MPLNNFTSKVFPRRKSSGNVLDDVQAPRPVSDGFRVMSQFEVQEKKIQQAADKEKEKVKPNRKSVAKPKAQKYSFEDEQTIRNSIYDNSSSSARYSSSSTLPSSTDKESHEHAVPQGINHTGAFSFKTGRTFTFGGRSQKLEQPASPDLPPLPATAPSPNSRHLRERSNTTSDFNDLLAAQKRLTLGDSDLGGGFENLFDGLAKPKPAPRAYTDKILPPSPAMNRTESEPTLAVPPKAFASKRLHTTPDPILIDRAQDRDVSSPLYSWGSRTSHDGLMSSPVLGGQSPLFDKAPPVPPHRTNPSPPRPPPEIASLNVGRSDSPYRGFGTPTTGAPSLHPSSFQIGQSSSEASPKQSASSLSTFGTQDESSFLDGPQRVAQYEEESSSVASDATPRYRVTKPSTDLDTDFAASAKAAMTLVDRAPATRVMNQDQFKSYQKQQEIDNAKSQNDTDSDDSYEYDEEDEEERQKDLAKQRRKQEATMSVYRQQMSKMTGEKPLAGPTTTAERPGALRTSSMPRMSGGADFSGPTSSAPEYGYNDVTDEAESPDEDTPLGILMAHGFPAKNRPPSKMAGMGISDRPSPDGHFGASSVIGASGQGLPPFARALPRDVPNYLGDGLHAPAHREPLMFGNAGAGSVYGGGSVAGDVPRNQTLVNVIANEERSKAMRRGSPNARNGFGPIMSHGNQSMPNFQQSPNMMAGGGSMDMGGMGVPSMQMPNGPVDPAFAQMMFTQQMLQQQLLQSQQAMAAMIQSMNGMGGMSGPMSPMGGSQNGFLNPHTTGGRPMSVAQPGQRTNSMVRPPSTFGLGPPQSRANTYGRPVSSYNANGAGRQSMLSLSGGLGPPQGYTPSIAPSERSTVGMASRYRAVNTGAADGSSVVSNTTLQTIVKPVQAGSSLVDGDSKGKPGRGKAFLSAFKRDKKSEEEEEEDWSDMVARRSRVPSANRQQKQSNDLKDLWPQTA